MKKATGTNLLFIMKLCFFSMFTLNLFGYI